MVNTQVRECFQLLGWKGACKRCSGVSGFFDSFLKIHQNFRGTSEKNIPEMF